MPRQESPPTFEYTLLGLLNQRPMHGYEIYKEITHPGGIALIWNIKQSKLYALLDKLADDGLLQSALIPGGSHPDRKEYRITPAGQTLLRGWLATPAAHGREMRQEFLSRLYFARLEGASAAQELVNRQLAACQGWLQGLLDQQAALGASQAFERLVFTFRIRQVEGYLVWLDDCRQ
jgi:PadR family transcriptional regulator AphA